MFRIFVLVAGLPRLQKVWVLNASILVKVYHQGGVRPGIARTMLLCQLDFEPLHRQNDSMKDPAQDQCILQVGWWARLNRSIHET